jgi:hypothetical protein
MATCDNYTTQPQQPHPKQLSQTATHASHPQPPMSTMVPLDAGKDNPPRKSQSNIQSSNVAATTTSDSMNKTSILPSKRRDSRAISFAEKKNIFSSLSKQQNSSDGMPAGVTQPLPNTT